MPIAESLHRVLPSFERHGNVVRASWDRLSRLPGGKRAFSRLIGMMAPYTGSMGAVVMELREGHGEVVLGERHAIRNHLRSVHAIALANLAELTGNGAFAYGLPDDARFIVAGLSIDYHKKARGKLRAISDCPVPRSSEKREYEVPVRIEDEQGDVVATATLRSLVGPKR